MRVNVKVWRSQAGRYTAYACVGGPPPKTALIMRGRRPMDREKCSFGKHARTPQAAIAKALKSLSNAVARRGRHF